MTESIIAFTRDWQGDHARAGRILSILSERSITTLYHFGEYGAPVNEFGRNWFAERVENLCFEYGTHIWIAPSDEDAPAWNMSRLVEDAGARPQPVLPRFGERQLALTPAVVKEDIVQALSRLAEKARLGVIDLSASSPEPSWSDIEL